LEKTQNNQSSQIKTIYNFVLDLHKLLQFEPQRHKDDEDQKSRTFLPVVKSQYNRVSVIMW